jgi:lipopolysaccharide transport system ATP-binding protein
MSDTIIKVENLGKKYLIRHQQSEHYTAFRDVLADQFRSFGKRLISLQPYSSDLQPSREEFWALKDISFEVKRGDRVGIIGRNGAGKTTLLKLLSRITEPTAGRIVIKGRVASLLEVGTGFHPELTGRENIFLNGAILGMTKNEIKRKFDEIVGFAEIEKFLDTPVKRYSSGMYVRLAFAVAAHLEPEILLVDEVLAVGDAAFQKKCLGKMRDVGREGRTVLFISHQMSAIEQICAGALWLDDGRLKEQGVSREVTDHYLLHIKSNFGSRPIRERKDRRGTGKVKIVDFYVLDTKGLRQQVLRAGEDYTFVIEFEKTDHAPLSNVVASIAVSDSKNEMVFLVRSSFTNQNLTLFDTPGRIECRVRDFNLASGIYGSVLFLSLGEAEVLDWLEYAAEIVVEGGDFFGTGSSGLPSHCKMLTRADWRAS